MDLGFFLAEAISLAVSKIGAYALMPLSQEFIAAGAKTFIQLLHNTISKLYGQHGYSFTMVSTLEEARSMAASAPISVQDETEQ